MRILQCVGRRIDNPGRVSIALGPDSILSDAQLKESPLSRALPAHYIFEMFRPQRQLGEPVGRLVSRIRMAVGANELPGSGREKTWRPAAVWWAHQWQPAGGATWRLPISHSSE